MSSIKSISCYKWFTRLCNFLRAQKVDKDIGQLGIFGTSGGQCIFEFPGKIPFSYTGTRAAHGNPYGFASRWSGQWIIHGEKGDLKRDGGRITIFKNGQVVSDNFLKDLDNNLLKDEEAQFLKFYEMIKSSKKNLDTLKNLYELNEYLDFNGSL